MSRREEQDARIEAILGDEEITFEEGVQKFYEHLKQSLQLPCAVKGVEDFRWEERYVLGPPKEAEYARLRKTQPSFQDTFELLEIEDDVFSEWMLFQGEDLGAHVRRKSDRKEFLLGLAELKAVDKKSPNFQLLDDYAVWFVNNR